jgi:integrase
MTSRVPPGSTYRDKNRGGWVAELNWKDRGIRRRWRGRTKREAEAEMEKYRQDLGAGLKPEEVTFGILADQYLAILRRESRPGTVIHAEWCLKHARPHLDHILVGEMTPGDIERMVHAVADEGLSPSSVRAIRVKVRAALQRAVRDRIILFNPVDAAPPVKSRRNGRRLDLPPSHAVFGLLDEMKTAGHPSWPILHVIAAAGLRTGEARGLRWRDVDRSAGVIHVRGQMDRTGTWAVPKTEAGVRSIPMTPRILASLDEMEARQADAKFTPMYVFADRSGGVPAAWTAHRAWTRAQEKQWGKVRLTVHQLRHLLLSSLVATGLPLTDVAKVAGHTDISVLSQTYAHALSDHQSRVREAMAKDGVG